MYLFVATNAPITGVEGKAELYKLFWSHLRLPQSAAVSVHLLSSTEEDAVIADDWLDDEREVQ